MTSTENAYPSSKLKAKGTLLTKRNNSVIRRFVWENLPGGLHSGMEAFSAPLFFNPCNREGFQQLFGSSLFFLLTPNLDLSILSQRCWVMGR